MNHIYLDHAAATPVDGRVLDAMLPYFTEKFYNPSATYWAAHETARELGTARSLVAHYLGARPAEITFTAGGTEANNLAIHGIMSQYPDARLLISAIEHDSVRAPAGSYDSAEIKVHADGIVDSEHLKKCIDDQTVLVSIMYANNEVGTIQPIREVSRLLADIRSDRQARGIKLPLYLHTDAAQAGNYLDLHAARLGVDLMTVNGGKLYGSKQSGILYVRGGVQLRPLIQGGGQEHNLRSGTENVAGAVGLAAALQIAQDMRRDEADRLQELQRHFMAELAEAVPIARINGSLKKRLPNNVHITIPGTDNERLLFALDEAGIQAAAGSACSASHEESSHVLLAMGLSDDDARASLRFTMGRATDKTAIDRTVRVLAQVLAA